MLMLMTSTAASNLLVGRRREVRLVDLEVLAARLGELLEILVQQLAEVGHHATRCHRNIHRRRRRPKDAGRSS